MTGPLHLFGLLALAVVARAMPGLVAKIFTKSAAALKRWPGPDIEHEVES